MLKHVAVVYFSPTGGTRQAALFLAEELAENVSEIDLSMQGEHEYVFEENDVVLFAVPAFGGRIPGYAAEKLKACQGHHSAAVSMVVYGNRAFEDSLIELNDCLKEQGFEVAASAALIAEHSMVREVAEGRPDAQDRLQMKEYAEHILHRLSDRGAGSGISVEGNRPYKEWTPLQAVPITSDACTKCGICSDKCPTQAISKENPHITDSKACILCMRCVFICPERAKTLPATMRNMLEQKLMPLKSIRRENELFID